uniref:Uncharacterized protein n=1 Tax=Kalanchoe fedtschenkoi TaxID=63787 RepID=A0A7N0U204_KALFE
VVPSDLVSRIGTRVEGWLGKLISSGGRITLIQSVLMALTVHVLASSPAPLMVLQRQERRHHWVRWSLIFRPFSEGGLGFKSLFQIMEGLLAKLAWRFWEQESLWAHFMELKYGHPSAILTSPQSGSAIWTRIRPFMPSFIL